MRILHTADWHIGQTLNGWSREAEHEAFLSAVGKILEEEDTSALKAGKRGDPNDQHPSRGGRPK